METFKQVLRNPDLYFWVICPDPPSTAILTVGIGFTLSVVSPLRLLTFNFQIPKFLLTLFLALDSFHPCPFRYLLLPSCVSSMLVFHRLSEVSASLEQPYSRKSLFSFQCSFLLPLQIPKRPFLIVMTSRHVRYFWMSSLPELSSPPPNTLF